MKTRWSILLFRLHLELLAFVEFRSFGITSDLERIVHL